MKIILIGNYAKDRQESMNRFATMLYKGYTKKQVDVEVWVPDLVMAKWSASTHRGMGKWLAYVDKFVLFPIKLQLRLLNKRYRSDDVRFHICDHSNSMYLNYLPKKYTLITVHDVLAIRGARGYEDAYTPATSTGVIFQKWILGNLCKAHSLAAVSSFTLNQLQELMGEGTITNNKWSVIHNGLNEKFWKMKEGESSPLLENTRIKAGEQYILHVGSDAARKNRKLLLELVQSLGDKYTGKICFAGHAIDNELLNNIISTGLQERVISFVKPDHLTLVALYSNCYAFIFPSLSEGFGWPVIEAQACGAPVITSKMEPFMEVGGDGVLYADPYEPKDFAAELLKLSNEDFRFELINRGYENCLRFNTDKMIDSYITLPLA